MISGRHAVVAGVLAALAMVWMAGCASQVRIDTIPSGAVLSKVVVRDYQGNAQSSPGSALVEKINSKAPVSLALAFSPERYEYEFFFSQKGYRDTSVKLWQQLVLGTPDQAFTVRLTPIKVFTLRSEPEGADVFIRSPTEPRISVVDAGGERREVQLTVDPETKMLRLGMKTPVTLEAAFTNDIKEYDFVLRRDRRTETPVVVRHQPLAETEYLAKMDFAKGVTLDLATYMPVLSDRGVVAGRIMTRTYATIDETEPSPNVKTVTRVTSFTKPEIQVGAPALSQTAEVLVYEQGETGQDATSIWREDLDTPRRVCLTDLGTHNLTPTITADGNYCVYSSDKFSPNPNLVRIDLMNPGGTTRLTHEDDRVGIYQACISPRDPNLVAFTLIRVGVAEPQIWTVDLKNINLLTELAAGTSPHISPNGRQVLYVRKDRESGRRTIWVMNIDGTGKKQLSPEDAKHDEYDPRWSADGNWIAFASNEKADKDYPTNSDVWLMTSDGKKRTQLTLNKSLDDCPCWNRDGTWIYFRSNRGGVWNIRRLQPVFP